MKMYSFEFLYGLMESLHLYFMLHFKLLYNILNVATVRYVTTFRKVGRKILCSISNYDKEVPGGSKLFSFKVDLNSSAESSARPKCLTKSFSSCCDNILSLELPKPKHHKIRHRRSLFQRLPIYLLVLLELKVQAYVA